MTAKIVEKGLVLHGEESGDKQAQEYGDRRTKIIAQRLFSESKSSVMHINEAVYMLILYIVIL